MSQTRVIQWFPGHMTKTKRLIEEHLKYIDLVIEILDARAPLSTHNPFLNELLKNKKKIVLLNKKDLADPAITEEWLRYYEQQDNIVQAWSIQSEVGEKSQWLIDKLISMFDMNPWFRYRGARCLVIGTPNVGKSTFINMMLGRSKAKAENRPGVTQDLIRYPVSLKLELFDTPGMLWHKFDDQNVGAKLALMGNIKENILPQYDIVLASLVSLKKCYPQYLQDFLSVDAEKLQVSEAHQLFEIVCKRYFPTQSVDDYDWDEGAKRFLRDVQKAKLGRLSWESPSMHNEERFSMLSTHTIEFEEAGAEKKEDEVVEKKRKKKVVPKLSSQDKELRRKNLKNAKTNRAADNRTSKHKKRYSR